MQTVLQQFKSTNKKVFVNTSTFYGVYTTGNYIKFFSKEEDAIDYCNNRENCDIFQGQVQYAKYLDYRSGEACYVEGEQGVYRSEDSSSSVFNLSPICQLSQIYFVKWE
jgi:hypothetical protein